MINRIRKKPLTDEELIEVRKDERRAGLGYIEVDPVLHANRKREEAALEQVKSQAIPLIDDKAPMEPNLEKLKTAFPDYEISGKVIAQKRVVIEGGVPRQLADGEEASQGFQLDSLSEFELSIKTEDGEVLLYTYHPDFPGPSRPIV